jgi:hypothetical protein
MSACAGSSTNASRCHSGLRGAEKFSGLRPGNNLALFRVARARFLKYYAGLVPMDRARQDWVYEHAETGHPLRSNDRNRSPEHAARLAASTLQGPCKVGKSIGTGERHRMGLPSVRSRPNGVFAGHGRPKDSAAGYSRQHPRRHAQAAARSVRWPELAACEAVRCA